METEKNKWGKILKDKGLDEEPAKIFPGKQFELGDGLGRKTEIEENKEDGGNEHSRMCPLKLGKSMDDSVDQPNENPVVDKLEKTEH